MQSLKVLVTGVTGFVGSELLRELLLKHDFETVYVMIRSGHGMTAQERFERLIQQWKKFVTIPTAEQLARVKIIAYDLSSDDDLPAISDIDLVFHAAASTDLGQSLSETRRHNVQATQRLLLLARQSPGLRRVLHFSTAYVSGNRRGLIKEDTASGRFHNHYERGKKDAESSVIASGLPYTIVRPSIIVGRSDNGYVWRGRVLYSVWRMWLSGLLPHAPLDAGSMVDIVPIDYVVGASLKLAQLPDAQNQIVHLCAGESQVSPAVIMNAAAKGFDVPVPTLSPRWIVLALTKMPWLLNLFLSSALRDVLAAMRFHLPYLGMRHRTFSTVKANQLLCSTHPASPLFSAYGVQLFQFCKDTAWGKKAVPAAL